jgi:tRNA pseudouridine55 synthase
MHGVLLIDKPSGPTSHDVVTRIRRVIGERSVGHTGTLDPRATGLLALVVGRATRLASLLTGSDKTYEAAIRLGQATSTDDAEGEPLAEPSLALPGEAAVRDALAGYHGTFAQMPPRHSAKKVGGRKAYDLARRDQPVDLQPVQVTVRDLALTGYAGGLARIRVVVSAGFYVRALARDLGETLGCGGHLEALRRTRSGPFDVADALLLAEAEAEDGRARLAGRLIQPAEALPDLEAVTINEAGLRRAVHGNTLAPEHLQGRWLPASSGDRPVKVLAHDGQLVALAWSRGGALHPVVVLGYH